jgi:hypothetical protein
VDVKLYLWLGLNFLKQKLGHLITFSVVGGGGEDKTFNLYRTKVTFAVMQVKV